MVFSAFERLLAFRYLRARRKEGFISVIAVFSLLGIFLGIGTLIVVLSVMSGFREELLSRILGIQSHLTVYGISKPISDYGSVVDRIRTVPGVKDAMPEIDGQVMIVQKDQGTGVLVKGMTAEDIERRPLIAGNIVAGSLEDFQGEDVVMIGRRLAERFGLGVGDNVTLIAPQFTVTTIGSVPRIKTYRIAALFEVGMYEYDANFVFMPLQAAQLLYRLPNQVNAVAVFLDNPDQARRLGIDVRAAAGIDYRVMDWQQSNASFFNAVELERQVMFIILSLIVVVAAFNIMSGQYMLVKNKGRDIAILRTMGATRWSMMRIFLLSGATVGVLGTALGVLGGWLFTSNINTIRDFLQNVFGIVVFDPQVYFLANLPSNVAWGEAAWVVLMGLGLSFLAPLFPAWRAARLDPVEALRYE